MSDFLGTPDVKDSEVREKIKDDAEDKVKTLSILRTVTLERRRSLASDGDSTGASDALGTPPFTSPSTGSLPVLAPANSDVSSVASDKTSPPVANPIQQLPPIHIKPMPSPDSVASFTPAVHAPLVSESHPHNLMRVDSAPVGVQTSPLPPILSRGESLQVSTSAPHMMAREPSIPSITMAASEVSDGSHRVLSIPVHSKAAFARVEISGAPEISAEAASACKLLKRALELREKHAYKKPTYYWGCCQPQHFPFSPQGRATANNHTGAVVPGDHVFTAPPERTLITPDRLKVPMDRQPTPVLSGAGGISGSASTEHLHGSKLVSLETGKEYGNLFYRRRLEPPFVPFKAPDPGPADNVLRFIDGVMCVFPKRPAGRAQQPPTAVDLSRGVSALVAAEFATPSRDFVEAEDLDDEGWYSLPENSLYRVPDFKEYHADYLELVRTIHTAYVKSFAYRRLQLLEARFHLHTQLNSDKEMAESKAVPHRDFYNVRKVDTHVHHSACMNQKHLLNFIKAKLKNEPDKHVIIRDGKELTLKEVFESLKLTAYDLSVDTLDMHADWSTFHRFDRFNLKYNPVGQSRLREIFLKTDNYIRGKYLAEITQEVFNDLEAAKYSLAEYRLSIYGKSRDEWSKLAAWVVNNSLASSQVRWMIQIPRLYEIYRETNAISSFQDMINNIFLPLFEVTLNPSVDPTLHQFLSVVVGFDSVDDESKQEVLRDSAEVPPPQSWTGPHQPPYYYWNYYLASNLAVLNQFRAARGLTQISFRPHSGEAGDVDHLAATFLTAESINHGINLRKNPPLQYLYYLAQVGLAMSPLSNNKLFVEYNKNPFNEYFAKGLNVSLSTDDPLLLSYTREPLIEEYCVAAQVWKLTAVDLCEIARNSVLQSGFEYPYKAHFIGPNYGVQGPAGNDIHSTNVPYIRLQYRLETLNAELQMLQQGSRPSTASDAPGSIRITRPMPAEVHPGGDVFTIGPPATVAMGDEEKGQLGGVTATHHATTAAAAPMMMMTMSPAGTPDAAEDTPNAVRVDSDERRLALAMHIQQTMAAANNTTQATLE